ncbi:uncharacterized protein Nmag_3361 [Natrialba magadii ATCC 43099]|uniref:Uncharacterized protein n=1 Tax=Natrialba magadii (strain ATCC 43099 / DSM 3394 / CCM 3739 / CIP 104546 / IAM 13178 / JCM 8861 / NBRC 102185 / NCIMB 2190 / MS3) TaxID=547559 RepID=D3SSR6_NATMM|nr:uncharacterized protein Nmag_3361 [Natrialba magadii ATCC 43099]
MTRTTETTETDSLHRSQSDPPDRSLTTCSGTDGIEDAGAPLVPVSPMSDTAPSGPQVTGSISPKRSRTSVLEAECDAPLVPDLRPLEQNRRSKTSD